MLVITSHILKSVILTKIPKSRYFARKNLFFLQIKKSLIKHNGYFMTKNSFAVEVTFNVNHSKKIGFKNLRLKWLTNIKRRNIQFI